MISCSSCFNDTTSCTGSRSCVACAVCDPNAKQISPCSGSSDVVCSCNPNYYGDGKTCNPCSVCEAPAYIKLNSCSGNSDTTCQCGAGYTSQRGGKTCNPCSVCEAPAYIKLNSCSGNSDITCQCAPSYFSSEGGGTGCNPCSVCEAPAYVKQKSCTANTDTTCKCAPGYFSIDGSTCSQCSTCTAPAVSVKNCASNSNSVCGIITNCQGKDGSISQCISPQTCFSCSTSQSSGSSSGVNVGASGGTVTSQGSASVGVNSQSFQGSNIVAGFCCDTSSQDCKNLFCTPPKTGSGSARSGNIISKERFYTVQFILHMAVTLILNI